MLENEKNNISIFDYDDYLIYLQTIVAHFIKTKRKPSSLGEWAMRLGYKSPRSFGMILDGKRLPSEQMIDAFSDYLKFSQRERNYFYELVKFERYKKNDQDLDKVETNLKKLNPSNSTFKTIEHGRFKYIAKWYHFVLKQLISGNIIRPNYRQLSQILRKKVSPNEIEEAIENLLNLKLLEKDKAGNLKSTHESLNTPNDIPSEAIKCHQHDMFELAKEALFEQSVENREFQTLTFKVDKKRIPEIKEFIRDFKEELNERFASEYGIDVHQLNIQFFSHTFGEKGHETEQ